MAVISMKDLLESGVHFGHQTRRWDPKMKDYIYGQRNGIYIIDLKKTAKKLQEAARFIRQTAASGGSVLFVGTKKQARDTILEEASRCSMFYVNQRWLGGMLTNFQTVRKSVTRLKTLEKMAVDKVLDKLPKKEVIQLNKEKMKLEKILNGVKHMEVLPSVIFVVDAKKEAIAIKEAKKLNIPVVGLVDTNSNPDLVDYVIPGNDDAIRSIRLITSIIAESVIEGRSHSQETVKEKLGSEDDDMLGPVAS